MKHVPTHLVVLLPFLWSAAVSQPASQSDRFGSLHIETDVDSAIVRMDSLTVGYTPLDLPGLLPGTYVLDIIDPDLSNWLTQNVTDSITVVAGEQTTRRYALQPRMALLSDPSGAEVLAGDSVLGTTPLLLPRDAVAHQSLVLRKEGYDQRTIMQPMEGATRGFAAFSLTKAWNIEGDAIAYGAVKPSPNTVPLYVTGVATVLSGAAAAYFKIKADSRYQNYQQTGDQAFLRQTDRLDTAAAISLALTQAGLALFTYYILSE